MKTQLTVHFIIELKAWGFARIALVSVRKLSSLSVTTVEFKLIWARIGRGQMISAAETIKSAFMFLSFFYDTHIRETDARKI